MAKALQQRARQLEEATTPLTTARSLAQQLEELTAKVNEITQLDKVIQEMHPLFDQTRKGFDDFANKYIKIPYAHILGPEFYLTRRGIRLKGLHHDFLRV